jgi:isochorismate synthase
MPDAVVDPLSSASQFLEMVAAAVASIRQGELSKVVLARQVNVHLASGPDLPALLARWRDLEPNCTVFSMPTADGRFVGASPELLVERRGDRIASRPLAGTTGQGSFRTDEALLRSPKDADEHRLVVEAIRAALAPHCSTLEVPDQPELVRLRNVVHLGTAVTGSLRAGPTGAVPTALELVDVLHPTPAVGGVPRATALRMIGKLESGPRGHYAGPVGFVDADGDGTWVVGIRAATLHGDTARLTAGVGIVADSEPADELAETDLKLRAVLDILTAAEGLAVEMQNSTA